MEPGSPEIKRFRDLPHPSLNEALKAETRLAVKLSEAMNDDRIIRTYCTRDRGCVLAMTFGIGCWSVAPTQ